MKLKEYKKIKALKKLDYIRITVPKKVLKLLSGSANPARVGKAAL